MNNYYLLAFNKQLRPIEIIKEEEKSSINDQSNLKYIDLVSSKYNEEEFRNFLLKKGIIEKIDTPICIVNEEKKRNRDKEIKIYRVINKGMYNDNLENYSQLLEKFIGLYDNNQDFKDIANFIITKSEIDRIFRINGYSGRIYKLEYHNVRNIVFSFNIFNKYHKLDNYPDKDNDYISHKDEINSLLEPKHNI